MRFIHTSDWHLGRILDQFHLTDDQRHVLDQLAALAKDEDAQAILVSGDIYDRGVPPPEAVELLNDFASKIALDLKIPLIIIAGNHDSRQRLGFGAKILQKGNLFVFGAAKPRVPFVDLQDAHGPVRFYAFPYAEPAELRSALGDEAIRDHKLGFERCLGDIRSSHPKGLRSVILAHCFASGGQESDSERPLVIGGGGMIDSALFDPFDYAALGHLHRPQRAGKARYSGSLLKYSKSEANHQKSVCVVEMGPDGACKVERRSLSPRKDLRIVDGIFEDLLKSAPSQDYVHAVIRDKRPVLDGMSRLRQVFPNLLMLERPEEEREGPRLESAALANMNEDQLFEAFFEQMAGEKPSPEETRVFREEAAQVRRQASERPL